MSVYYVISASGKIHPRPAPRASVKKLHVWPYKLLAPLATPVTQPMPLRLLPLQLTPT
jgi:hypothetical protein